MNKDELAELQKTTLEMVRQTTAEVVKPISDILGRLSSSVDSIVEENTIDMMLMTAVFHAAVNSGLIEVKDKEDDLKQRSHFFESIQRELTTKKRYNGVSLENLIEEGLEKLTEEGAVNYVLREKSRLYELVKLVQSKPYKANFKKSDKIVVTTSKVLSKLIELKEIQADGKQISFTVSGSREKKPKKEYLTLSKTSDAISLKFGEYTAVVHDTIGSLYDQWKAEDGKGYCIIPLPTLHEHITRKDTPMREAARKKLETSIDNMRNSPDILFDYSESALMYNLPEGYGVPKKTKMINARCDTYKINGRLVDCLIVFDRPIFWRHAIDTKKFCVIGDKDFVYYDENGKELSLTEKRLCAIRWLLKRLYQLRQTFDQARDSLVKYQRKQGRKPELELPDKTLKECIEGKKRSSDIWSMNTLFEVCEVTDADSKTDLRYFVTRVLEQWKKSGKIVDYKKIKSGKILKSNKSKRNQAFDSVKVVVTQTTITIEANI